MIFECIIIRAQSSIWTFEQRATATCWLFLMKIARSFVPPPIARLLAVRLSRETKDNEIHFWCQKKVFKWIEVWSRIVNHMIFFKCCTHTLNPVDGIEQLAWLCVKNRLRYKIKSKHFNTERANNFGVYFKHSNTNIGVPWSLWKFARYWMFNTTSIIFYAGPIDQFKC